MQLLDSISDLFPVAEKRELTFSELKQRPALFLEKLFVVSPDLHNSILQKEKTLKAAKAASHAVPLGVEKEKFQHILDTLNQEVQNLYFRADQEVLHFLDNPDQTLAPFLCEESESNAPIANVQNTGIAQKAPSSIELLYRTLASEILLNNNQDRFSISRKTGIPLSTVISTLDSYDFQQFLNLASEQMTQTGLFTSSGRLRELLKQYAELESVRMKRAFCASRADQVPDEEFIRLGLSPQMRDLEMALEPGGDVGLLKKTPITLRAPSERGRGSRTETINNYELDSTLLNHRNKLIEQIAKEQESNGTKHKPVRKVYGFDTSEV